MRYTKKKINSQKEQYCFAYFCVLLSELDNSKCTPKWLKARLLLSSVPEITILDDIANYVILEYGQYLRVYDYDRLITLNSNSLTLQKGTVAVFCNDNVVSTAGFFDSNLYSLTKNSKNVVIEYCTLLKNIYFINTQFYGKYDCFLNKVIIFLNKFVFFSVERLNYLVKKLTTSSLKGIFYLKNYMVYLKKFIILRKFSLIKILGKQVNCIFVFDFFLKSNIKYVVTKEFFYVIIPETRVDVVNEIDLIGSIIRFFGINNVQTKNSVFSIDFAIENEDYKFLLNFFKSREYYEVISYSFIDLNLSYLFNKNSDYLHFLSNPISTEMSIMRPSLLPGLIKILKYNYNRQCARLKLFEIGEKFYYNKLNYFVEQLKLISGVCFGTTYLEQWGVKKQQIDFFDLKNDLLCLILFLNKNKLVSFKFERYKFFDSVQSASIFVDNEKIGFVGAVDFFLLKKLKIRSTVFAFELDFKIVLQNIKVKFNQFSNKPFVRRDLSIILKKTIDVGLVVLLVQKEFNDSLQNIVIFDVYFEYTECEKSVSFGLFFQHYEKTLNDSEVNKNIDSIIRLIYNSFKGVLRQ